MDAFKPHLSGLGAYPYRKVEAAIKLDQNESPWDLPEDLKNRALERMRHAPWNRYPTCTRRAFAALLARFLDWPAEGIVVAPGSNFLLLALAQAARRVLDTSPSFAFYEGAARVTGTPYRSVPLGPDFALPVDGLIREMDAGEPGVVFVATPHAPTGAIFPVPDVGSGGREGEGAWVDPRHRRGLLPVLRHRPPSAGSGELPHIVILRTFSKAFGLGGVARGLPPRGAGRGGEATGDAPALRRPRAHRRGHRDGPGIPGPGRRGRSPPGGGEGPGARGPLPAPDLAPLREPGEFLPRANPGRRGRLAVAPRAGNPRPTPGSPSRVGGMPSRLRRDAGGERRLPEGCIRGGGRLTGTGAGAFGAEDRCRTCRPGPPRSAGASWTIRPETGLRRAIPFARAFPSRTERRGAVDAQH